MGGGSCFEYSVSFFAKSLSSLDKMINSVGSWNISNATVFLINTF